MGDITMADVGRFTPDGNEPSLQDLHHTDQFLDALATGRPMIAADAAERELASLLAGWRDDVRTTPSHNVLSERDVVAALQAGLGGAGRGGGAPRQGRRFPLTLVGSVAAAVLCLGGFGAVIAGAGPGDPLYGLRSLLFGEQQTTRNDEVMLAAQTELAQVQELIEQGRWEAAQERLQAVTTTVAQVEDEPAKQELVEQWQELSVKVEARDPAATVPPDAPPPPATLFELPPVTETSTETGPTVTSEVTVTTEPSPAEAPAATPSEPVDPAQPSTEPAAPEPSVTTTVTVPAPASTSGLQAPTPSSGAPSSGAPSSGATSPAAPGASTPPTSVPTAPSAGTPATTTAAPSAVTSQRATTTTVTSGAQPPVTTTAALAPAEDAPAQVAAEDAPAQQSAVSTTPLLPAEQPQE